MHSETFILTLNIFKKKMLEKHETLMRQKNNNWKTDWYFDSIYPCWSYYAAYIYY